MSTAPSSSVFTASLPIQVITVRWDETGEEHMQKLHDIQEGRGRVDWAAVKKAFRADLVEIKDEGTPELLKTGDREGLTRASFQPGSAILVSVSRKSQGVAACHLLLAEVRLGSSTADVSLLETMAFGQAISVVYLLVVPAAMGH